MSWQAYVDTNLVGTGYVQQAAILGRQGGVWAKSQGFEIKPDEEKAVLAAFDDADKARANGVKLGGKKFFTIQADDEHVYGKKGADGCVIVRTNQAVLVAEYVAPTQAAEATNVVEKLADYLKSVNF